MSELKIIILNMIIAKYFFVKYGDIFSCEDMSRFNNMGKCVKNQDFGIENMDKSTFMQKKFW